jgi:hypothetical protein
VAVLFHSHRHERRGFPKEQSTTPKFDFPASFSTKVRQNRAIGMGFLLT